MSSVTERADSIYHFLRTHLGQGFTLPILCQRTNLEPGAKTTQAIRRARDMATAAGLHFPPAVASNGYTYKITELAEDAYQPTLQMQRTAEGVQRRADVGWDFLERHRRDLPEPMRGPARAAIRMRAEMQRNAAEQRRILDDLMVDLLRTERLRKAAANGQSEAS